MGMDGICELTLPFEEVDMWLIPHIQWDVINFLQYSVTVISDDTDVLVLILFHFKKFSRQGLRELYQKGQVSDKKMQHIHTISTNIEEQFCRTLLKAHLGTGTDYLSKIEKKKSSLNANPEVVLKELGVKLFLDKQTNPRS